MEFMEQPFLGKVALVTGGTSGIGRAAAELLAQRGASVVLSGRRAAAGQTVVAAIEAAGGRARFVPADLAQPAGPAALVEATVAEFGRLDIAVDNAGTEGRFAPITELTEADWHHTTSVNLTAVWLCLKAQISQMVDQGQGGAIVLTSSWLARGGLAGSSIYSASKAGLDGMARAIALETAEHGVRVNTVNPGIIDTEMFRRFALPGSEQARPFTDHVPSHRLGSANQVAELIGWLCSDAASYVTGQSIAVDGGYAIPGHRWTPRGFPSRSSADNPRATEHTPRHRHPGAAYASAGSLRPPLCWCSMSPSSCQPSAR
jgi:NAD(P)-dependent dehydrogenase (short-subunit alcohol dehydrogenase family)